MILCRYRLGIIPNSVPNQANKQGDPEGSLALNGIKAKMQTTTKTFFEDNPLLSNRPTAGTISSHSYVLLSFPPLSSSCPSSFGPHVQPVSFPQRVVLPQLHWLVYLLPSMSKRLSGYFNETRTFTFDRAS